jgi:hypothetical protein
MAERKALKSPPHVAAHAGEAKKSVQNRIAVDRNGVHLLDVRSGIIAREKRKGRIFRQREGAIATLRLASRPSC